MSSTLFKIVNISHRSSQLFIPSLSRLFFQFYSLAGCRVGNPTQRLESLRRNPTQRLESLLRNPTQRLESLLRNPNTEARVSSEKSNTEARVSSEKSNTEAGVSSVSQSTYCWCQGGEHGKMVACDNPQCAIEIRHMIVGEWRRRHTFLHKGKKQLSLQEVECSQRIAKVQIHVERVIGLLKNRYSILQTLSMKAMSVLCFHFPLQKCNWKCTLKNRISLRTLNLLQAKLLFAPCEGRYDE